MSQAALGPAFFARPVLTVAAELVGCVISHGGTAGVIVETEAYHESEPACHAYVGRTARTGVLFGPPGTCYAYRSYGIHALLNAVCEPEGTAAAVLIRALEPLTGVDRMSERRPVARRVDLCNGPGKLSQALGVELAHNATLLTGSGPLTLRGPAPGWSKPALITGPRIGISKARKLPWRFCARASAAVSRPWPEGLSV